MLVDQTIEEYVMQAASGQETPGGGSVSALCAALGSCMASMAANFTVGREKFAAVEEEVQAMLTALAAQRTSLLKAVDADAEAFDEITAVYSMPKGTEEEKQERTNAMQAALTGAMEVPLGVMRSCVECLRVLPRLAEVGNTNLITDTGVAAIVLAAANRAARLNVAINLKYMQDDALVEKTRTEIRTLVVDGDALAVQVAGIVEAAL